MSRDFRLLVSLHGSHSFEPLYLFDKIISNMVLIWHFYNFLQFFPVKEVFFSRDFWANLFHDLNQFGLINRSANCCTDQLTCTTINSAIFMCVLSCIYQLIKTETLNGWTMNWTLLYPHYPCIEHWTAADAAQTPMPVHLPHWWYSLNKQWSAEGPSMHPSPSPPHPHYYSPPVQTSTTHKELRH